MNQNNGKNRRTSSFANGKQVIDSLDHLFQTLHTFESNDLDFDESTISINENLRKVIEQITLPKLLEEAFEFYQQQKHDYTFVLSADGKMGVFSWESRINGLKPNIRNVALYVKNHNLVPTSLYRNPTVYDKIYNIKTEKGNRIYILTGWRKSPEDLYYYTINAYSIKKDGIEEVNLFPNNQSYLETVQKAKNVAADTSLNIKVMNQGKQLLIPKVLDSMVFYDLLVFDGRKYVLNTQK